MSLKKTVEENHRQNVRNIMVIFVLLRKRLCQMENKITK